MGRYSALINPKAGSLFHAAFQLKAHARQELLGEGPKLPPPIIDALEVDDGRLPSPSEPFVPEVARLAALQTGQAKASPIVIAGASLPTDPAAEQEASARYWRSQGYDIGPDGAPILKQKPSFDDDEISSQSPMES